MSVHGTSCIASKQGMVYGASTIYRNFRCKMFSLLTVVGMMSLTMPLFSITLYRLYFNFLWNYWILCGIFENEILLMYRLEA